MKNVSKNQKTFFSSVGKYLKSNYMEVVSVVGFLMCLIVFSITSGGTLWSEYNVGVLIESVCVFMIISLGAVFVYAMGYMDVSVGGQLGVYCILTCMIINATGSLLLAFLCVLIIAVACGAFNGAVAVWLKLPSIVTSLFLMFVFGGLQPLLMETTDTGSISANFDFGFFIQPWVMVVGMVFVGLIVTYFFNFTKLGKYTKGIGANELTTSQCGVNTTLWKVIAYMAFGVCVAIGSVFLLARTGAAGKGTGSGYAMDIMLCLILGGMPLSGGSRAKVRCAVLGSLTYALLSNGLILSGVDMQTVYIVKAIVFLIVVCISCRDKSGYLPR